MSRHGYLDVPCWRSTETPLLRNTASAPTDERHEHLGKHVFDALHSPPPMSRHDDVRLFAGAKDGGVPCTQADMLPALNSGADVQKTLLFVAGATGAGKSHMVRWLHGEHVRAAPEDISIHIPRTDTNLVRVVEILAQKLSVHGAGLRRLLADAGNVDIGERGSVELDLVTGLSDYARRVVEESRRFQSLRLSEPEKRLRRSAGLDVPDDPTEPAHIDVLSSAKELQRAELWEELIRIKGAEIALTTDGGPLVRMQSEDPDERMLDEKDLAPLQNLSDEDVPPKLHGLRNELADPHIREWILRHLITPRAMDFAVQRAGASIKAEALQKALQEALDAARRAKIRVVFFFEDWGTVTGVRSGLLEVFTSMEAPHVAVVADTTDELRRIRDNVADRSIGVFEIGRAVDDFAQQLAARALNAVRNGGQKLLAEHDRDRLPNACVDCSYRVECHRSFGAVEVDGLGAIGSFPLTPEVIGRTVTNGTVRSTPRGLLIDLVRPVLQEEAQLRSGDFPSRVLVDRVGDRTLRLDSEQRRLLQNSHPNDAARIERILELYRSDRTLNSLPSEVASAFGLEVEAATPKRCVTCGHMVCQCPRPVAPEGPDEVPTDSTSAPADVPRELPLLAIDAERFSRGEALTAPDAFRRSLRSVAEAGVRFGDGIDSRKRLEGLTPTRLGQGLLVLGQTQRGESVVTVDGAKDGETIRALAWSLASGGSFRDQDVAHGRRASAMNLAAEWGNAFDTYLRDPGQRLKRALPLLRSLAVLNSLTRESVEVADPYDVLDLALGMPGDLRMHIADRERNQALGLRGLARDELLADIALVQGDGDPFGVDIDLLHDALLQAAQDGGSLGALDTPSLRTRQLQDFVAKVTLVVREERVAVERLQDRLQRLGDPFPPKLLPELDGMLGTLRATINDKVGRTPPALRQALEALQVAVTTASETDGIAQVPQAVDVATLLDLQVHAALVRMQHAVDRLEPHTRVRAALVAVLREVESLEGGSDVAAFRAEVSERLQRFNATFKVHWRLLEPSREGSGGTSGQASREPLLDALREAVQLAGSAAAVQQTRDLLEVALENLDDALAAASDTEDCTAQATALNLKFSRIPSPPVAPEPTDILEHAASHRIQRWTAQLRSETVSRRREVLQAWQDSVEERRVPDLLLVAQNLEDDNAEEAFRAADDLAAKALNSVPADPATALQALEEAARRAWRSLERYEGPGLDLAKRIRESGGTLPVTPMDAETVRAAIDEGTLSFEVRLRER